MKLSEILAKPIKLKGGGILNIKGFSKQVVDEEVGETPKTDKNIVTTLSTILGIPAINQEFVADPNGDLIKIDELPVTTQSYYTLIKKSDYEAVSEGTLILWQLIIEEGYFNLSNFSAKNSLDIKHEFNIDGETYYRLKEHMG